MDFALDDDQQAIAAAVGQLVSRFAGPRRSREVAAAGGHDSELWRALDEGGFLDLMRDEGAGPLAAAMVTVAVSRAAGVAPVGCRALVVPALTDEPMPGPVALAVEGATTPVRFAPGAATLLVVGADEVKVRPLAAGEAVPVRSRYGYAFGHVPTDGGDSLGPGTAEVARRWWRMAVAAETVGTMEAALQLTTEYLKDRHQFGRPIASFQAVQHRLAEAAVSVEGARWLTYQAAWADAPAEDAASAAAFATATAKKLAPELHQLSGAIGFTLEYDLHVWSMRLQALRLELDGVGGHARAVALARWGR